MLRRLALVAALAFSANAAATDFQLKVDGEGGRLPQRTSFNGFGCTGQNLAPALHWQGAPANTRSFVLTVYDPDAPTGSGWWHWVVIDLPAGTHTLPAGGGLPAGAHAVRNDYGQAAWGGPCPPTGDAPHHYMFTVYALDVPTLDIPADATPALVGFAIRSHVLGKGQSVLTYGR
jgi:Raf kinase inhibitor-like YbhB/YbcL family protein